MDEKEAMQKAKERSKDGFVQHVNKHHTGYWYIDDWYSSGSTVHSYEDGIKIN